MKKAKSRIRLPGPGTPTTYGPYTSNSPWGKLSPLTVSSGSNNAVIKEYHAHDPVVQLIMIDGALQNTKYYGQVARNCQDWNLTAVQANSLTTVYLSFTSNTLWNTINPQDGSELPRNGYTLTFERNNQPLLSVDRGMFGINASDNCGQTYTITYPSFQIDNQVFDLMDSVVVLAKADSFWACHD